MKERVFGGLCFALLAFVVSTGWLYVRWRWMSTHPSAPGVIVEHVPQARNQVAEAIQYTAVDGRVNRMLGDLTSSPLPIGTKVTVRYDPDNPRDGVVEASGRTYTPILMGMLISGLGAVAFGAAWWKMADEE